MLLSLQVKNGVDIFVKKNVAFVTATYMMQDAFLHVQNIYSHRANTQKKKSVALLLSSTEASSCQI